jgi:hypothetical protein
MTNTEEQAPITDEIVKLEAMANGVSEEIARDYLEKRNRAKNHEKVVYQGIAEDLRKAGIDFRQNLYLDLGGNDDGTNCRAYVDFAIYRNGKIDRLNCRGQARRIHSGHPNERRAVHFLFKVLLCGQAGRA